MAPRIVVKNIQVVILFAIVLAVAVETAHGKEECIHFMNMSIPYWYSNAYPEEHGKECFLRFEAPPGRRIILIFRTFTLNAENCASEYAALYDGDSTSDILLGRFCTNKIPHPIISTGHRLLLVFRRDRRSTLELQYSTDIHFVKVMEDVDVESPNYPLYRIKELHAWEFETIPGHRIILEFKDFELEAEANCSYDYVELYGGKYAKDHYLGRFCGTKIPQAIKSKRERMLMIFRTDASTQLKGFTATLKLELNLPGVNKTELNEIERNLIQYLLNRRRHPTNVINKWGTDITRTAVALYMADERFFASNNETGEEIAYELILQLMSKLVMKKRTTTNDLAQYINALTIACIDPKNFFGVNIVDELRRRIDNSSLTNPFFILTLCNVGENMTTEYIPQLQQIFDAHLQHTWTDSQAVVVMALKCISERFNMNLNTTLEKMATELKGKQQHNDTIDNLENTALVIQALRATENDETNFNLSMAIKSIIKNVKQPDIGIEEIYYILPTLKLRTLLNINSNHCEKFIKTDIVSEQDLEKIKTLREQQPDIRIQVQVSIVNGDDMDFSSTRKIKVPPDYSFYQVLENISASEPEYKLLYALTSETLKIAFFYQRNLPHKKIVFSLLVPKSAENHKIQSIIVGIRYKIVESKPYVTAVGSFKDSIADRVFWLVYTRPISSTIDPILVKESPVDIKVKESEELILWYRSERWPITQERSSDNIGALSQIVGNTIKDKLRDESVSNV